MVFKLAMDVSTSISPYDIKQIVTNTNTDTALALKILVLTNVYHVDICMETTQSHTTP